MRGQFVSGSKRVRLEKVFKVADKLIWLRFKVCWAWDGVWGR
jgi:hypothetical protein